ncbi:ABC transporter ATP-binding protein [candidate division KSB1 bacterium]|nr:ABC transporter ATP-binding protein [candidate division KSB1 bacterium]
MNPEIPILETKHLEKSYWVGRSRLPVLKGLDIEIKAGEIVAIIGPSGVGKSTLLHLLGALDRPSRGKVLIQGVDIFRYNDEQLAIFRNRTVGFVFQFHHLLPEFTALENIAMPALMARVPQKQAYRKAMELLNEVGLWQRAHHRPAELSGGEQQRVAVARALMNNPRLLLADEPSGNLDQRSSNALHRLIWHLSRTRNQTFIVVTHNLQLAEQADRVIELSDGRIKNNILNGV